MGNCYFEDSQQAYEVFVDESRDFTTGECGYGVWWGENNPNNCNYKVYGNNSLQNATYQGIEWVLDTTPAHLNLNIYVDRKPGLDTLHKIPLTPRDKNLAYELNMINKITSQLTNRAGKVQFFQVYSPG